MNTATDTATLDTPDLHPATACRSRAERRAQAARASLRNGDRLLAAGFNVAAAATYQRAAMAWRDAAEWYIDAAGSRGGSTDDSREALACIRKAHGADLLAEGVR